MFILKFVLQLSAPSAMNNTRSGFGGSASTASTSNDYHPLGGMSSAPGGPMSQFSGFNPMQSNILTRPSPSEFLHHQTNSGMCQFYITTFRRRRLDAWNPSHSPGTALRLLGMYWFSRNMKFPQMYWFTQVTSYWLNPLELPFARPNNHRPWLHKFCFLHALYNSLLLWFFPHTNPFKK